MARSWEAEVVMACGELPGAPGSPMIVPSMRTMISSLTMPYSNNLVPALKRRNSSRAANCSSIRVSSTKAASSLLGEVPGGGETNSRNSNVNLLIPCGGDGSIRIVSSAASTSSGIGKIMLAGDSPGRGMQALRKAPRSHQAKPSSTLLQTSAVPLSSSASLGNAPFSRSSRCTCAFASAAATARRTESVRRTLASFASAREDVESMSATWVKSSTTHCRPRDLMSRNKLSPTCRAAPKNK
mmetsp:Transcript_115968/g.334892  ORF Transcript_115968/g.334892 Transcript_115968/m.334892 type:complete len:241 (-) Transcript_115968:1808-2530(-)